MGLHVRIGQPSAFRNTQRNCQPLLGGPCRNPFSLGLKRLLINLRLAPGDVKTRPLGNTLLTRDVSMRMAPE